MGLALKWDITYRCNLNCNHCLNGHLLNEEDQELSIEEVRQVIENLQSVEIDYIHLLGGEPTFRKDFYDIIDYLNQCNIKYGFNTNGLKLTNEKLLNSLSNQYLSNIVVSLEGPTAEINDHVRGINVFDIVVSKIAKLSEYKRNNKLTHFTITVNMVVSQSNYKYINDMIDLCLDIEVDELNLLDFIVQGNAENGNNQLLGIEEELYVVNQIARRYSTIKDRLKINPRFVRPIAKDYCEKILELEFPTPVHGCGAGTKFAFINNTGKLYPCDRYVSTVLKETSEERLDLTKNSFLEVWDREIFNYPFEMTESSDFYQGYYPCNECKHLQKTCYPCPVGNFESKQIVHKKCKNYFDLIAKEGEEIG